MLDEFTMDVINTLTKKKNTIACSVKFAHCAQARLSCCRLSDRHRSRCTRTRRCQTHARGAHNYWYLSGLSLSNVNGTAAAAIWQHVKHKAAAARTTHVWCCRKWRTNISCRAERSNVLRSVRRRRRPQLWCADICSSFMRAARSICVLRCGDECCAWPKHKTHIHNDRFFAFACVIEWVPTTTTMSTTGS